MIDKRSAEEAEKRYFEDLARVRIIILDARSNLENMQVFAGKQRNNPRSDLIVHRTILNDIIDMTNNLASCYNFYGYDSVVDYFKAEEQREQEKE